MSRNWKEKLSRPATTKARQNEMEISLFYKLGYCKRNTGIKISLLRAVTLHKYLSQDESLFYAHVTSGAVWHLTFRRISPSQDSYFGHMVLANNVRVNLGLDSYPTLARGFPISLSHTPTKSFVFLPPRITESMAF